MDLKFHLGTSGWSYRHWKGLFYPEKLKQKDWLPFYAESFNSVEVNMTFYRLPGESTVEKWFGITGDDFLFTLKAPGVITHNRRLAGIEGSLDRFYTLVNLLGHKGKCILFQLPPSFHLTAENLDRVNRLLKLLNINYDHVLEFRHSSWWCDQCYRLLEKRCGFCTVNGLGMPSDLVITGDYAYLRFHGENYDTLYTDPQLQTYVDLLYETVQNRDLKRIYIYFNNDYRGFAVKNGMRIKKMIAERFGIV